MKPMPTFPKGEPAFIPLLKSHQPFIPNWDTERVCASNELDATRGIQVQMDFPDNEKLLDTAVFDLNRFLDEAGLKGTAISCVIRQTSGLAFETYIVTVTSNGIQLEASDLEGARRAIYYLMDKLAFSPFLPIESETRTPWLKNRISRCFFGPIKRPPHNIDELMNDIDYYPEEYLSRLAHEGINGLWLTITFREICDCSLRPACPDAARRQAKLRASVERCRRYGIKIFAFCIEPCYWSQTLGNPLPKGAEELLGPGWTREQIGNDMFSFCPKSDKAQKYLYECTNSLFKAVPHLGGMINVSFGERTTSCLSMMSVREEPNMPCGDKCDLTIGEIFRLTNTAMAKGMKDANPDADFISWLYIPEPSQACDWIYQMPSKLNGEVALTCNFESGVTRVQLGKVRAGGDYWLSAVGPGDRFGRMAQACQGHCDCAAKIQVGNSHEVATIPYVPIPGTLYRKYKKMKQLGVKHVIQCWYFGNYPGLMNEAAGKLAYEDFTHTEDEFLESLAKPAWGKDYQHAIDAWKLFAEGYSCYPMDIQFQYYGPMHDGPVWKLYLKKSCTSLTRSWQPDDFPAGDAIGKCMTHFTLDELVRQSEQVASQWHKGLIELQKATHDNHLLDFTLAEALDIQFTSGYNILKFYLLRSALESAPAKDAKRLLDAMSDIVKNEIARSRKLAELCQKDPRLGYHSEAEVFKYFADKLIWRADDLQELLDGDFKAAYDTLERTGSLHDFIKEINLAPATEGNTYGENGIHWSFDSDTDSVRLHVDFDGNPPYHETAYIIIYDIDCAKKPTFPVAIAKPRENAPSLTTAHRFGYPLWLGESSAVLTANGWHADLVIDRAKFGYASELRIGVERVAFLPDGTTKFTNDKPGDYPRIVRLNLGYAQPTKTTPIRLG
ncbi:MAG: hypothetical protein J6X55_09880 [Victivallales bacterium]|nr:hypothetical protein [Victivallales bacterium]